MIEIDAKPAAPIDPQVEAIIAELRTLADPVYPLVSDVAESDIHTRLGTIEVFPDTMTPASWSGSGVAISRHMQKLAGEMGLLEPHEKLDFQGIFYGCIGTTISSYIRMNRRLDGAPWAYWTRAAKAVAQPHADPIVGWAPPESFGGWLADCWVRVKYARKGRACDAALEADLAPLSAQLEAAEAEVAAFDFAALDAAGLIAELKKPSIGGPLVRLHSGVTVLVGSHYLKLAHAIARWTDLPAIPTANALLVALGDVESAKPALALRKVAALLRPAPRLATLLRAGDFENFAAALEFPQDDHERLAAEGRAAFLRDFGYRGIGESTLDATTWAEDPEQADRLLALYLDDRDDRVLGAGAAEREAAEQKVLARTPSAKRATLRRYIDNAQKFAAMRERTKSMSVRQSLRTRKIMRALIARLIDQGVFESPDDREMLTFREFTNVLTTDRAELRALIARRRRVYDLMRQLDIVEVTFRGLPTPRLRAAAGQQLAPVGAVLNGLALSPGCVEGIACVVTDTRQGGSIRPGEILVAPYTDAAWSPLFLLASAVVIDSATLISHGATVARELGLPAVANAPGVASIQTGDRIRVDADRGEITILARGEPRAEAAPVAAAAAAPVADPRQTAVLRAVRLKGHAQPEAVAVNTGFAAADVQALLAGAAADGLCAEANGLWSLTPTGHDAVAEGLAAERPDKAAAEAVHEAFLPLNGQFKQLAFDWQMRDPQTPNDHQDAAYDAAIVGRLDALHAQIAPLAGRAAQLVPRLAPYGERFSSAVAQLKAGETPYLTSPRVDSYHSVWFEFHEELIAMTGRTRAEEAAAGRAA